MTFQFSEHWDFSRREFFHVTGSAIGGAFLLGTLEGKAEESCPTKQELANLRDSLSLSRQFVFWWPDYGEESVEGQVSFLVAIQERQSGTLAITDGSQSIIYTRYVRKEEITAQGELPLITVSSMTGEGESYQLWWIAEEGERFKTSRLTLVPGDLSFPSILKFPGIDLVALITGTSTEKAIKYSTDSWTPWFQSLQDNEFVLRVEGNELAKKKYEAVWLTDPVGRLLAVRSKAWGHQDLWTMTPLKADEAVTQGIPSTWVTSLSSVSFIRILGREQSQSTIEMMRLMPLVF